MSHGTSGGVELTDELIERLADEAAEGYVVKPGHRPKNRRRWCKGRVGIEHLWGFWEPGYRPWWKDWYVRSFLSGKRQNIWAHRICEACGRIDYYYQRVEGAEL